MSFIDGRLVFSLSATEYWQAFVAPKEHQSNHTPIRVMLDAEPYYLGKDQARALRDWLTKVLETQPSEV